MAIEPLTQFAIETGIAGLQSIFGGAQASSQQAKLDDYNDMLWKFEKKNLRKDYRYAKKGRRIAIKNEKAERGWRDQTAINDYNHAMAIRDYEYSMQMKAYNKSEETYKKQLGFNNMAAAVAMESENRFLEEQRIENAFQNQDLFVQTLLAEGEAAVSGQAGRSAGKRIQSILAQSGRNQAILVESMVSADKQYKTNLRKIAMDKYGADIAADANRMIKPEALPEPPRPIPLPKSKFQKIKKPLMPPEPMKGLESPWANAAVGFLGSAGSIAAGIDWG